MDNHDLLAARATRLEKLHYKFRVTSRGYEVYWRHHVLARVEHYDDAGPANSVEHLKLATENMRKAVKVAEEHEAALKRYNIKLPWSRS